MSEKVVNLIEKIVDERPVDVQEAFKEAMLERIRKVVAEAAPKVGSEVFEDGEPPAEYDEEESADDASDEDLEEGLVDKLKAKFSKKDKEPEREHLKLKDLKKAGAKGWDEQGE